MNLHLVGTPEQPTEARPVATVQAATLPRAGSRIGVKPWMIAVGAVSALTLVLALTYAFSRAKAPQAMAPAGSSLLSVTAAPASMGRMTHELMVTGSLSAFDELPVGTETTGFAIKEVLVDEGDEVKAGQLLARFNDDVLKADLLEKEASLKEAKGNADEANANIRRAEELYRTNAISGRDLDNRRALAVSMVARVAVAEANLATARAHLRQTEVRAPADGRITVRTARLGAVLSAGGTELFRILRDDRVQLAADVPEQSLPDVKPGQVVTLTLDGDGASRQIEGRVRLVSPIVDPKTRLGTVKIDLPRDPQLRPGMFAHGHLALGVVDTLSVPDSAVVYKDAKPMVFVVKPDNKVEGRLVTVGARENGRIAILANLKADEKVVTAGAGYLKDGDLVTVVQPSTDPLKPLPKAY